MKPLTPIQQEKLLAEILACFAVTGMRPIRQLWFTSTTCRYNVVETGEEGRKRLGKIRGCALGAPIFATAVARGQRLQRVNFDDAAARKALGVDTQTVVGIRDGFDNVSVDGIHWLYNRRVLPPRYVAGYEVGAAVAAALARHKKE